MPDIDLNLPQLQVMTSKARIVLYIAGIGAGKSRCEGYWSLERGKVPGSLGLIVASDGKQVRTATLPRLQEAWAQQGFIQDEHYVINRQPPKHWGIQPFSALGNTSVLTWYWGAYAIIGGVENFESYRGPEFDYIVGDEVRGWRQIQETIQVFTGRLRGQAYTSRGMRHQMLLATSPPDDPEELEQFFDGYDVEVIHATTMDNLRNLPGDYIESQQARLDEVTYKREVLGEMISLAGMKACYSFSPERHPLGNVIDARFDPLADTYISCDFNSSMKRPMSWVAIQKLRLDGQTMEVVTAEWINKGTQTVSQCEIVFDDLVRWGFRGKLWFPGDATGEHGNRGSAATMSDYQMIARHFRSGGGPSAPWQYRELVRPRTRRVKNRIDALNARFQTMDRRRHLWISDQCRKTITACTKLKYLENGHDLEDTEHNDPVAALSYYPYTFYPVHLPTERTHHGG